MIRRARLAASTGLRALLAAAFGVLKLLHVATASPVYTGDGRIWARVAENSLFSRKFWLGPRPFSLPLIYKLIGSSDERLLWFQAALAIVAWVLLAWTVSALLSSEVVSVLAFALVLMLGLTTPVHGWDIIVRSESVSISFLFVCFAAVATFVLGLRHPHLKQLGLWAAAGIAGGVLAAFGRETNAYVLPFVAALAVAGAVIMARATDAPPTAKRASRAITAVLVSGLLLTSVACQANTRASGRFAFPLINVVFQRILPNPEKLAYFRDEARLPVSDELYRYRFKWASSDGRSAFRSEELTSFRAWIYERGYGAYQRYLSTHPSASVAEAWGHYRAFARSDFKRLRRHADSPVTRLADAVILDGPVATYPVLTLLTGIVAGVAGLFRREASARVLACLLLVAAAAALAQVYVCYHGDAMELDRHGVMVGLLLRLTAVLTVVSVADVGLSIASRRREKSD